MLKPARIISVDFLRGLTVAGMILVNNPGSWEHIYAPLEHSAWNGCTPTDLVFPFFLFIVGISISYSLSVPKASTENQSELVIKIIRRAIILFLLGLFLNFISDFSFSTLRIPGVLQRIALVFLVAALLFLKTSVRTQITLSVTILISYWLLMTLVPVPGVGIANLEPNTNLGAWLDYSLLKNHLWKFSKIWDPEGILGTFPAIVSGIIGVLTGIWLRSAAVKKDKIIRLFVVGIFMILMALVWNMVFPINKNLWTSSFVLFTSGIALNVLAVCYWLIDVQEYRKYTKPFLAFGSNAIAAYMLSEVLSNLLYSVVEKNGQSISVKEVIFQFLSINWINLKFLSFVLALSWVAMIWLPINWMYKRKILIKV
jgi:predicted acyltransferase